MPKSPEKIGSGILINISRRRKLLIVKAVADGLYINHFLNSLCSLIGYDNHNMPPSKVVHCRAVADGCKETDLVQVMRPFGNIKYVDHLFYFHFLSLNVLS